MDKCDANLYLQRLQVLTCLEGLLWSARTRTLRACAFPGGGAERGGASRKFAWAANVRGKLIETALVMRHQAPTRTSQKTTMPAGSTCWWTPMLPSTTASAHAVRARR